MHLCAGYTCTLCYARLHPIVQIISSDPAPAPTNPVIAEFMRHSEAAVAKRSNARALQLLAQVLALFPRHVAAWRLQGQTRPPLSVQLLKCFGGNQTGGHIFNCRFIWFLSLTYWARACMFFSPELLLILVLIIYLLLRGFAWFFFLVAVISENLVQVVSNGPNQQCMSRLPSVHPLSGRDA